MIATLANTAWLLSSLPCARQFRQSLHDPQKAQQQVLASCIRRNEQSDFGKRHHFDRIRTIANFRDAVPLSTYDDYIESIDRIRAGEPNVLTSDSVTHLMPSSGSTAARKLIPYTRSLQRQFSRAIAPWIADLFTAHPNLLHGQAYWSISPLIGDELSSTVSKRGMGVSPMRMGETPMPRKRISIGFEDDTHYLGRFMRPVVNSVLAVPSSVRHIRDMDAFRFTTLSHLLNAENLRLISVWHPSFLTLLLNELPNQWAALLDELPRPRSRALARLAPTDYQRIWPNLKLISCWTHAHAARPADQLRSLFPHVTIQPKGLLATEAFVSIPVQSQIANRISQILHPLAIRSHFFEFLQSDGTARFAHELETGGEYTVVVTTSGGVYRYQLHDRIRVTGFLHRTPCIEFLGKEDRISDRFGEKLSEAFVAAVLDEVLAEHAIASSFILLAPEEFEHSTAYTLYIVSNGATGDLEDALDCALTLNPHYRYCRALGQLAPARVQRIAADASQRYLAHQQSLGQRLGDIKPAVLSPCSGWDRVFASSTPVVATANL